MNINLDKYKDEINLLEEFLPEIVENSLNDLLKLLLKEASGQRILGQLDLWESRYSKREIIKALITIRPSGQVSDELIFRVDTMLQEELKKKNITDSKNLEKVNGNYPIKDKVSVWNGDIATLKIDAIVNAANSQFDGCFVPFHNCIDNVIHNAAGIMLREDCSRIIYIQNENEGTGQAKITRGYNLPSKYVIHTVGPIVSNGLVTEKFRSELENSYLSCLNVAKESGLVKSIAFCGISTGIYGFPKEEAAKIALETVSKWMLDNPGVIEHVVFNTYGEEATNIYERLLEDWNDK
jgi:O-acetyl-ADP-ribose deacetylase (regulator of RNase III)